MYGYEWSLRYLWRWLNWLQRLDVIVLAFMLVRIVVVVIDVFYRCHLAGHGEGIDTASGAFQRGRRTLVADLNQQVGSLKWIASTAPFLGLAGICIGILNVFRGYSGSLQGYRVMAATYMAAALTTTAAGIIVAVSATFSFNYLRTCLDLLVNQVPSRRLPLEKRFSGVPAFVQIAAPALALCITAFMFFPSLQSPQGLHVRLMKIGSLEPENCLRAEPVLIRLLDTSGGPLAVFVNSKRTPRDKVKDVLQSSLQPGRIVNIAADKEVRWADVASAIDVAEGVDGDVVLLTGPPNSYSRHNW